jgi:hypothetical protein
MTLTTVGWVGHDRVGSHHREGFPIQGIRPGTMYIRSQTVRYAVMPWLCPSPSLAVPSSSVQPESFLPAACSDLPASRFCLDSILLAWVIHLLSALRPVQV